MYFMARDEASLLELRLRRQIADKPKPKLVLYYPDCQCDYLDAAAAITASIGPFTEATLMFLYCPLGDGWNETLATNERWGRYRRWRATAGELRRLHDAPGHKFGPHEAGPLSEAIAFALRLGWDAVVAASPGRQLLVLSYDDRIEIYRGFDWRQLAEKLIELGFWHGPAHA
jgi:hypothetical protein